MILNKDFWSNHLRKSFCMSYMFAWQNIHSDKALKSKRSIWECIKSWSWLFYSMSYMYVLYMTQRNLQCAMFPLLIYEMPFFKLVTSAGPFCIVYGLQLFIGWMCRLLELRPYFLVRFWQKIMKNSLNRPYKGVMRPFPSLNSLSIKKEKEKKGKK